MSHYTRAISLSYKHQYFIPLQDTVFNSGMIDSEQVLSTFRDKPFYNMNTELIKQL